MAVYVQAEIIAAPAASGFKVCRDCGQIKALDAFYYVNRLRSDRRRPDCKKCHSASVCAYQATPRGRDVKRRVYQRALANGKERARQAARRAVRRGILQRQPCEVCGRADSQAHHDDYDQPLVVRWLCSVCHGIEHRHDH